MTTDKIHTTFGPNAASVQLFGDIKTGYAFIVEGPVLAGKWPASITDGWNPLGTDPSGKYATVGECAFAALKAIKALNAERLTDEIIVWAPGASHYAHASLQDGERPVLMWIPFNG